VSQSAAANELIQANNTYEASDSFSKVLGKHTMKFSGAFHAYQVNGNPIAHFNGPGSVDGDNLKLNLWQRDQYRCSPHHAGCGEVGL
jgi:hypothetical protein